MESEKIMTLGKQIIFELDFGTEIIVSEKYYILYDENLLSNPDDN